MVFESQFLGLSNSPSRMHALAIERFVEGKHRRTAGDVERVQVPCDATPARWAGATVRLGWLLQELLRGKQGWCLVHALECALFMAGYDCQQINPPARAAARVSRDLQPRA